MANILHRPGVDPVPCHLLVVFATDSLRKEVYLPRRFAARPVSSKPPDNINAMRIVYFTKSKTIILRTVLCYLHYSQSLKSYARK
jgi:hypothetical protein